jgi:transcriptional regulator with XRE-family HTH domain
LAEKVALSISTISKLEKSDGVAQIELLRALKEMAEKSNEFRDALRMEFLSKDAADGKIIKIINEHCRNCPRKVSK